MLQLSAMPAYWWPVDYTQPGDGGVASVQAFEAQFRQLDDDEYHALLDRARLESLRDRDVASQVLSGVRGVVDPAGNAVESTPEALSALLRLPGMGTTLWLAYSRSRGEAALGNLPRSPAGGAVVATATAPTTLRH